MISISKSNLLKKRLVGKRIVIKGKRTANIATTPNHPNHSNRKTIQLKESQSQFKVEKLSNQTQRLKRIK